MIGILKNNNEPLSSKRIMIEVTASLVPAIAFKIYSIGWLAVFSLSTIILSCLLSEIIFSKVLKTESKISDISSLVTAVILFLCFNANMPYFIYIIASVVSIVLGKIVYGGLGKNIFNPAIVGWCFSMISFPKYMTTHINPTEHVDFLESAKIFSNISNVDAISQATPMGTFKTLNFAHFVNIPDQLFIINLLILLGGLFLVRRGIINLIMPMFLCLGIIIGLSIFNSYDFKVASNLYFISGPVMLAAFYIVTDPATSPNLKPAQALYSLLIGFIGILIAYKGAYPIGIAFATLIMNSFVFLLDSLFTKSYKKEA